MPWSEVDDVPASEQPAPIPARLGWGNAEDPALQLRLYATDVDNNGRWTPGADGRVRYGRTIEHALTEHPQQAARGRGHGREGDRYVVLTTAAYEQLIARVQGPDDSHLVAHAVRELALLPDLDGDRIKADWMRQIVDVVAAFARTGQSGGSAGWAIATLNRLLRFEPLTPLTDDRDDWIDVADGVWQCRRHSEAFSNDGGKTYYLLSERDATGSLETTPVHRSEPAPKAGA